MATWKRRLMENVSGSQGSISRENSNWSNHFTKLSWTMRIMSNTHWVWKKLLLPMLPIIFSITKFFVHSRTFRIRNLFPSLIIVLFFLFRINSNTAGNSVRNLWSVLWRDLWSLILPDLWSFLSYLTTFAHLHLFLAPNKFENSIDWKLMAWSLIFPGLIFDPWSCLNFDVILIGRFCLSLFALHFLLPNYSPLISYQNNKSANLQISNLNSFFSSLHSLSLSSPHSLLAPSPHSAASLPLLLPPPPSSSSLFSSFSLRYEVRVRHPLWPLTSVP